MSSIRPAISAHRGGGESAPAGTWEAFNSALELPAEYVEFDVRLTRDRNWVVYHDEHVGEPRSPVRALDYSQLCDTVGYPVPQAIGVMELLARRAIGHLDLKENDDEQAIVGPAIDIFGTDGFVVTTENPASIRRIKAFAPDVRTALSTGNPVLARSRRVPPRLRSRRFDVSWILNSGADRVALNHQLASDKVLKACRRSRIGVMLWTVNEPELIARHLADPRIDVLITDRPQLAARVRAEMTDTRSPSGAPLITTSTPPGATRAGAVISGVQTNQNCGEIEVRLT